MRACASVLALLLAACASSDAPREEVDRDAVARYRSAGYVFEQESGVVLRKIDAPGSVRGTTCTLATAPGRSGAHPVIVYLPPLGDSSNTTSRWLDLWARAGYAVIALQALDEDAQIWTSAEARSGDFARVGRARFGADVMIDRVARLGRMLADLRSRSVSGEPALAGLDWTHWALAGSDLGAYTVQSIAGMTAPRRAALDWPSAPNAFVAISPYARRDPTPEGAASAGVPLLMISSPGDVDAYGVVADAALRRLAFEQLAAGDHYFLEIDAVSHRWLAGLAREQQNTAEALARNTPVFRESGVDTRRDRRPGGSAAPPDEDDPPPVLAERAGATRDEREAQLAQARNAQLTRRALNEVRFEDVSIAFLDGYVRQNERAKAWLRGPAASWLDGAGRLEQR